MSHSLHLPFTTAWTSRLATAARAFAMALLLLLPGAFSPTLSAAETLTDKVDNVSTEMDSKLDPGDARTAAATSEINKNAKWLLYLLWLVVPMITYGILIPTIISAAKQNEMDSVKRGIIALVLGSVLYFGAVAVFFG